MSFTETIFRPFFDTVDGAKINRSTKSAKECSPFFHI